FFFADHRQSFQLAINDWQLQIRSANRCSHVPAGRVHTAHSAVAALIGKYPGENPQLATPMKSRARDEVGVANRKLEIGKPKFFAIFSLASVATRLWRVPKRPTGPWLQLGEVAEWSKAALC
ncbi:MAG TPA: hypothetical protein VHU16_05335, partial [Candidatus Udaeobacter sp.]|nr:hypothetical protein [Candidatus Udaeobacter sp.]